MPSLNDPSENRLCLYPIKHADIFANYEQQKSQFWSYEEIQHGEDYASWCRMNSDEQTYIASVLAFFANSDNAVMDNLSTRFAREITWPEVQLALGFQRMMEGIHVVSYNNMIDSVIKDRDEKLRLFRSVEHNPVIRQKIQWTMKWAGDPTIPLVNAVAAQACAEGIGFASSFAAMMWLRTCNLCPGISFGNQKIILDESLHVKLFGLIYKSSDQKMSRTDLEAMVRECVQIEYEFIDASLPKGIKNMNATLLKQYVQKTADVVLEQLGEPPMFNATNPFPWMEPAGIKAQTNFFERTVAEYQVATHVGTLGTASDTSDLDF